MGSQHILAFEMISFNSEVTTIIEAISPLTCIFSMCFIGISFVSSLNAQWPLPLWGHIYTVPLGNRKVWRTWCISLCLVLETGSSLPFYP